MLKLEQALLVEGKYDAAGCTLRYGEDTPGLTLRPGRSMIWEEAQTIAVQ